MPKYLVVGQHSWSKNAFDKHTKYETHTEWEYFSDRPGCLPTYVKTYSPTKIFFTHWSFIVPPEITDNYECICFHPSHLPYGRGGTPIQNLIKEGFTQTRVTAFKMNQEIDAGPIYLQYPLGLEGSAQEIYERIAEISWSMIHHILKDKIIPIAQEGTPIYFKRRTSEQSEILGGWNLDGMYDHIRMLSAEGYPHAFIEYGDYIIEFMEPSKATNSILANAVIYRKEDFDD